MHCNVAVQLAQRRARGGGRQQYLVKWQGYEADVEEENWLGEEDMADVRGGLVADVAACACC